MLNLDKSKKYLLACSGGADSMALFFLLVKEGYDFDVAHINYHYRKTSDEEENIIKGYADKYNKKLYVYHHDGLIKNNLENEARIIRYNYFKKLCDISHYEYVLVAHNEDDNIETYIMQKMRKNLVKYYGIQQNTNIFDVNIYRPLLTEPKSNLELICLNNAVPYKEDESNSDLRFLRNRIRKNVVSNMSIQKRQKYLDEIKENNGKLLDMFTRFSSFDFHTVSNLKELDDIELAYIIVELAKPYVIAPSIAHVRSIKKALNSSKPNIVIRFKNCVFVKEYDKCLFLHDLNPINYSYRVNEPTIIDNDFFHFELTIEELNKRKIDLDDFPLTIRNARPKDKVSIAGHIKDVKRAFIDYKMPLRIRRYWPVIVSRTGEIIYMPRYQGDFKISKSPNFYVNTDL